MAHTVYYATAEEFEALRDGLKQRMCPVCGRAGFLNRHSMIYGEDGLILGQRVFCRSRNRKGPGCGHTFRLLRSDCLPGFRISLAVLWRYLQGLIEGRRKIDAFRASGCRLHESAAYRLYRRLWDKRVGLRTRLFGKMPVAHPPTVEGVMAQTFIHLAGLFPSVLPLASFQHAFQTSFL